MDPFNSFSANKSKKHNQSTHLDIFSPDLPAILPIHTYTYVYLSIPELSFSCQAIPFEPVKYTFSGGRKSSKLILVGVYTEL